MNRFIAIAALLILTSAVSVSASRIYSDVPEDHWAAISVDWVSSQGIMTGPTGREAVFLPSGSVNRAELATVVTRLQNIQNKRIDELELKVLQLEYNLAIERQKNTVTTVPPVKK